MWRVGLRADHPGAGQPHRHAVGYGSDGTTVTVAVHGDDTWATITVHNRGAAIAPEQLDGIFNPMKARGASGKPNAQGPTGSLGLGLYIAERIVAAHDGRIEVESSEAGGTTFTVYLTRHEHAGASQRNAQRLAQRVCAVIAAVGWCAASSTRTPASSPSRSEGPSHADRGPARNRD